MFKLKKYIYLLFLLSFNSFAADQCLTWESKNLASCSHYNYTMIDVKFFDRFGIEQGYTAKKIIRKSDGEFLHADYDFIMKCAFNCNDIESATNQYFEDWRNALISESTYMYELDDGRCTKNCGDINPFEAIPDDGVTESASRTKSKINLENIESITTSLNNAISAINGANQIKSELENQGTIPTYIVAEYQGGQKFLCKLTPDGSCKEVNGTMLQNDKVFEARYEVNDFKDADLIRDVIYRKMVQTTPKCKTQQTCYTEENGTPQCSVSISCFF